MSSSLLSRYKKLGQLELLCIAFFDLVGSTHLKKQLGQSRGVDLAVSHNQLAAEVSQQFRGRVIKHIGDSIMAVFDTPLEGMLAALEFVRTIKKDRLPFQTKVGLTHGTVTRVDTGGDDYLGQAVDRSARLTSQALPNQVLMDETTMEIIKPFIGDFESVISRFLGLRELKGLGKVPVYEVALAETGFVNEEPGIPEVRLDSADPVQSKPASPPSHDRLQLPPLSIPSMADCPIEDDTIGRILESCTLSADDLNAVAVGFQNINHILEKAHDIEMRQMALSGSFSRGTMIKPLSRVEVIAVLAPPNGQQRDVGETLDSIGKCLSRGYPGSVTVSSDNQVDITLGKTEFAIIPVMAVFENGRGQLMVPSRAGGFWVAGNPAVPEQWMGQAVKRNGPAFLPFLRLIRAWQTTNCDYVNPFHIEMLSDLIASRNKLDLSFESVYQWFWYAYHYFSQNKKPFIKEPNQSGTFIDEYMYSNAMSFNRFSRVLTNSYNLARQGIAYHRAGERLTAMARWKAIFGPYLEDL